ncbi:MAG: adenylate/guanylate cyclase domain-containing protein [Actinomycetota bacterium]|nr:adenylate/guanylate cyclase domain-containing protein [Actinomycetota bacterium]
MTSVAQNPATRYARSGDAYVAYQRDGSGPPLVLVADWFGHLDTRWEWPPYAGALRRLGSFSTLISFDKRGTGLSDPVPADRLPDLEHWMDDVRAVIDDVGAPHVDLMGVGAGAAMVLPFAATHPERVDRIVLVNAYGRLSRAPDYPAGFPPQLRDRILATAYTDPEAAAVLSGVDGTRQFFDWWLRYQRQSVSPGVAAVMRRMMFDVDVRSVLASIQAPTLVVHRRDDQWIRVDHGRYLAAHIPGAELVELDGDEDLFFQGDVDELLGTVEQFLRGVRRPVEAERVLATIMFTDLVGSTPLAAGLGDSRWRQLLDDHDDIVERTIAAHGGRKINTTGDGVLALFDGTARAIRAAAAIRDELGAIGLQVRAGVHVGEVERRRLDVGGIAVNIAARIMSEAAAGEVRVSRVVRDLVAGSGLVFMERGVTELKGVPGEFELFAAAV